MAQRISGYARKPNDVYPTPSWATEIIVPHLRDLGVERIFEPAEGDGDMVRALRAGGFEVTGSDIRTDGVDFLESQPEGIEAIVTNPPNGPGGKLAEKFIRHALAITRPQRGVVAMLLRMDFDSGRTRGDLFGFCPAWAFKVVAATRIDWFPRVAKSGQSVNYAWYVWSWRHGGVPMVRYWYEPKYRGDHYLAEVDYPLSGYLAGERSAGKTG
jgi:hypothetical protein